MSTAAIVGDQRARQRAAWRKWRSKNVERERERNRKYSRTRVRDHATEYRRIVWTPEKWLRYALTHAKHRAKKAGIAFDITADDIEVPETCPVLGMPLDFSRGKGRGRSNTEDSPSLDRFDNLKGYVRGNVRVISQRANALKSNATIEEIRAVLAYMESEQ